MVSVLRAARAITIEATDGYRLGATIFETRRARTTVVIHGATAVPQTYYAAFAEWLAGTGVRVVTYDFRGIGASRRRRRAGDTWSARTSRTCDLIPGC